MYHLLFVQDRTVECAHKVFLYPILQCKRRVMLVELFYIAFKFFYLFFVILLYIYLLDELA